MSQRTCRVCGCTDDDCRTCIEKTGRPYHWVAGDLCSACVPASTTPGPGPRLQIEATDTTMLIDGIPCRVWNGTTEAGAACLVFVHRVILWNGETELPGTAPVAMPRSIEIVTEEPS